MKLIALGDIATIERNSVNAESIIDGTIYVGLENITGDGTFENVAPVSSGELSSSKFQFNESHVLYGKLRPYLKKTALPTFSGICSTDILPIKPSSLLDRRYLFYFLRQQSIVDFAASQCTGINLPRLSPQRLNEFVVPLPALAEQKRIAAILDQADALRVKRRAALARLDRLVQAVFLEMFGDPVTNPMGWEVVRFESLLDSIDSGWSPNCEERTATHNEWGVLKLGAVTSCRYIGSENKALPSPVKPKPELEVKIGDILFSRKNTYDLVAACALVRDTPNKLMLSDLIFRLKLREDAAIEPEYLWALLVNDGKRKKIQSLAGGAAGSMPNISKAKLRQVEIELPPIQLQQKFVNICRHLEYQRNQFSIELQRFDTLFHALQQRAFRGEL